MSIYCPRRNVFFAFQGVLLATALVGAYIVYGYWSDKPKMLELLSLFEPGFSRLTFAGAQVGLSVVGVGEDPIPNCDSNLATSQGVRVVDPHIPRGGWGRPRCVVPERGPRSLP